MIAVTGAGTAHAEPYPHHEGIEYGSESRCREALSVGSLVGANLAGCDLTGAWLPSANLTGANLAGANLYNAFLIGGNLTGADLRSAKLINMDLRGARLSGANLTWASLNGSDLASANLDGVTGWHTVQGRRTIVGLDTATGVPD